MNNKNILLKLIQLINAIKDNDISQTEKLVEYLNNNFNNNFKFTLNDIIPFRDIINNQNINQDSLYYVINHLNNIRNIEELKWLCKISQISKRPLNFKKVEDFIIDFLNTSSEIKEFQFPMLTQLSVSIDRIDLLNEIRNRVKNQKIKGVEN